MSINKKLQILFMACLGACSSGVHAQWQQCAGTAGQNVHCLAMKDSMLFAGTDSGIFFSADTGNTWTLRSTGITADTVLALLITGSNVFAGTHGGGIFHTINNGLTWQAANNGITNNVVHCFMESGTQIFAGADNGEIFLSVDSGLNWSLLSTGITQTPVNALAGSGTEIFAAHNFGIFVSADSGTSWTTTGITVTNFISFAVHDSEIYAGSGGDGVFYTADNFVTWSINNNGMSNLIIESLVVSDSDVFAASSGNGVYVSTDHAANWATFNAGLTDLFVHALATGSGYVFAGTLSDGVWRRVITEVTSAEDNLTATGDELKIFPNPVSDNLTVESRMGGTAAASEKKYLSICNSLGQKMIRKSFSAQKYSVNISGFPKGVYFIEVRTEKAVMKKIVVKM